MRSDRCTEYYEGDRKNLGYNCCLPCGNVIAKERKFTVAPLNKSNYVLITDLQILKQLNPKRTEA
jgi:hypothetical protein